MSVISEHVEQRFDPILYDMSKAISVPSGLFNALMSAGNVNDYMAARDAVKAYLESACVCTSQDETGEVLCPRTCLVGWASRQS